MMKQSRKLLLLAAFVALVIPMLFAGTASAKYVGDNAVPDGTGGWSLPEDKGFCISGIKRDGTMIMNLSVGNNRNDCIASIFPAYATSAACFLSDKAGANVEGSHYWSSACVAPDGVTGISLSGLDRTRYMCEQKGGTYKSACTSSWVAMGPTWSASPVSPTTGGTDGFCYASMRLDNYTDNTAGTGTCPQVKAGSPGSGTLGYSWNTTAASCVYVYGINGRLTSALTYKDGGTSYAANAVVDLSALNMGQCLAIGASFANHTTKGGNVTELTTLPAAGTVIAKPITQVRAGCLSCHNNTTQYNSMSGRWKSDYLKQGHKNMLRKVTPGTTWAGPDADGVIAPYTQAAVPSGAAAGDYQNLNFATAEATTTLWGTKPLMYLFGDWMAPAPDGLDTVVWMGTFARYNGVGTGYSCAACHATGWRNEDTTKGLCTVSSATTLAACTTAGGTWYPMSGAEGYGKGGAEPMASFPAYAAAGPPANIPGITGQWDWDGINCNRCHKVAYDPTLPINDEGVHAPPGFTTHETDIFDGWKCVSTCFSCHQSIANENNGIGANKDIADATKIPVKNNKTAPAYQPEWSSHVLGASFLNSPHGQYTGAIVPNSLGKYDLVAGGTSASSFAGKLCRSALVGSGNSPCPTAPLGCGSILETKADGHVIKTLEDCNLAATGTVSSANLGYWQDETGGGSCITCHNVHESLFVADAKEPLRRECTTCHTDKPVVGMRHPIGYNTPEGLAGDVEAKACEICHMPKATSGGFPMHLWRINSSASYRTFPTAAEFGIPGPATKKIGIASPDGSYTNAVWVDVDYACGQCHGGGPDQGNPVYAPAELKTPAPYYNKATLAAFAANIHLAQQNNTAPVAAFAAAPVVNGYLVSFTDASTDAETAQASLAITVNWGDGTTDSGSGGGPFSHTYLTAGTFTIALTAADAGGMFNTAFSSPVTVPTKFSLSGTIFDSNGTTGLVGATVTLKQGGVTKATMTTVAGGAYAFANNNPGTYQVEVYKYGMTFDGDASGVPYTNPINVTVGPDATGRNFTKVAPYTVTVNTSPALSAVTVYLKQGGSTKYAGVTGVAGNKVFTNVTPGTYQVQAVKTGYVFDGDAGTGGNQNPVTVTGPATVTFTHTP